MRLSSCWTAIAVVAMPILCARAANASGGDRLGEAAAALGRGDNQSAAGIYQSIIAAAPDSDEAAFACDTIADINGRRVFPEADVQCSTEAAASYSAAEAHFMAR